MNACVNPEFLSKAIQFATRAHHNQLRKGTDLPYIVHPFAVGMILSQFRFSEQVIAAGLLHDTLEDTGVTEQALAGEFGAEIATIVAACSEPDKSLPWRERKQHTIDSLITAPWQVKAVVAADKLDNLRAMSADYTQVGDALWQRFKHGLEEQQWYYGRVFRALLAIGPGEPTGLFQLRDEMDEVGSRFFARVRCTRSITLDRRTCEAAWAAKTRAYIVVDPETCAVQLVEEMDGQGALALEGHEDLFPLGMAFESDDSFLPGGDWTAVSVSGPRKHDGVYRSYRISWK
jgi:hypothetical protein